MSDHKLDQFVLDLGAFSFPEGADDPRFDVALGLKTAGVGTAVRRAGELLSGSKARKLKDVAEHHRGAALSAAAKANAAEGFGARRGFVAAGKEHMGKAQAASAEHAIEKNKVRTTRTGAAGLAAAGTSLALARKKDEKTAGALSQMRRRAGQLLSGSKARELEEATAGHRKAFWNMAELANKASNPSERAAANAAGKHHAEKAHQLRQAHAQEKGRVLATRVGAGSVVAGGAVLARKKDK